MFRLALLLCVLLSGAVYAPPYTYFRDDGVPWRFPQPERLVVIGDIHGDLDAMLAILEHERVIDRNGNLKDPNVVVLFNGDLVRRGPNSRGCIDYADRLKKEMEKAVAEGRGTGAVHQHLGNHELMILQGDTFRYIENEDANQFDDFAEARDESEIQKRIAGLKKARESRGERFTAEDEARIRDGDLWIRHRDGMGRAFLDPTTVYGKVAELNSISQFGDTVVIHGGPGKWMIGDTVNQCRETNSTVRRFARMYQEFAPSKSALEQKPDPNHWAIQQEGDGPLWNRDLAHGHFKETELDGILKALGAKRMVIAHSPTESRRIESFFGGKAYNIDTRISIGYGGNLSALEIFKDGTVIAHDDIPRPPNGHPATSALLREFAQTRRRPPATPYRLTTPEKTDHWLVACARAIGLMK